MREEGYPVGGDVKDDKTDNEFHSSFAKNLALTLWFKTPFGFVFNLAISTLKNLRSKQYSNISSADAMKTFLSCEPKNAPLEPLGITKKVHNCGFRIDTSKAERLLGFKAQIPFADGVQRIKNKLREL